MLFAPSARVCAWVLALAVTPALAESPPPAPQDSQQPKTITLDTIEVISQELEAARLQIQPSLGASTYYFGPEALETIPQGENAPLNQVILQMPAVAQDSFGQIHVRGEHANVQFRINGVELPEGLSVFGQALETRFARSVSLLTGALPAQYGFFTAGVLDIQTKTGLTNPGLALTRTCWFKAVSAPAHQPCQTARHCRNMPSLMHSTVQKLDLGIGQGTELRLDVLNIGDAVYEIRNGTGVGVGAPQFGIRRTILAGLTQRF